VTTWFITVISLFEFGGPISSACRGRVSFWYEVYGGPAVCRCRNQSCPGVLGRNWRPMVPGLIYPDIIPMVYQCLMYRFSRDGLLRERFDGSYNFRGGL
jgi:hypothetical protein